MNCFTPHLSLIRSSCWTPPSPQPRAHISSTSPCGVAVVAPQGEEEKSQPQFMHIMTCETGTGVGGLSPRLTPASPVSGATESGGQRGQETSWPARLL